MADDWRNKFLPESDKKDLNDVIDDTVSDLASELGTTEDEILTQLGAEDEVHLDTNDFEAVVANLLEEGAEAQLAVVGQNQQRIMEAIDNMAAGFSSQLVILARRIDNFERVLDQSVGQPTMTNLMFDAPEVFNKVVTREVEEVEEASPAVEPRTPVEGFEIPDEVEHLLNYSSEFPVSVEVQAAFFMWKEKISTFQNFVKVAGGPVMAKKARGHLE